MTHVPWASIESFSSVRKSAAEYPHILGERPVVTYRAKVKLHGTNAGVRIDADGTVTAQSRNRILTPENDNLGFAAFVHTETGGAFSNALPPPGIMSPVRFVLIYGEWIGPGIMAGVATSKLPRRKFAVFAGRIFHEGDPGISDTFVTDPDYLESLVCDVPHTYVLPWYSHSDTNVPSEYTIDMTTAPDEPAVEGERRADQCAALNRINDHVEAVEKCDPWVRSQFGVEGIGEGLVLYPWSHPTYRHFSDLGFKAKGALHRGIKADRPVARDPAKAADAGKFAEMVVTPGRLEQAEQAVGGFDLRKTGAFLAWIGSDVQKECANELEATGICWKDVAQPIALAARAWWLKKAT